MDTAKIILFIAGFFVFMKALKYSMIVKNLLNLRFRKADGEIKQLNELPEYLETLLSSYDAKLQSLGFTFSHLHLLNTCIVSNFSQQWNLVCFNEDNNCYANAIISPLPETHEPVKVEFYNIFSDQSRLITQNGTECYLIGEIPNAVFHDPCAPTLEQQYMAHVEKLRSLDRESIKLSVQDYLASEIQFNNDHIASLVQKAYLKPQDETTWQFRLLPAMRQAFKILQGMKKIGELRASQLEAAAAERIEPIDIPVEVEVNAYLHLEDMYKQSDSGLGWKLMVFLVSLALSIAIFGAAFSFGTAFFIIGALIVHELGHYVAMLIFGYRDRRILFLPFGAATLGEKTDANVLQKAAVYLSGPAPGLIAGTICLITGIKTEIELLSFCGVFLLALNYINLLPLVPLDGGRLFELVLFSRVPVLKSVFLILSLTVMTIAAIFFKDPILVALSILMIIGVRTKVLVNSAHSRIQKLITSQQVQPDKEPILSEVFQLLRQEPFTRLPFSQKYAISKNLVAELMQKPPGLTETIVSLALYLAVFALPILTVTLALVFLDI